MTKFSWKDAPDLMDELARIQNHPCNSHRDIMTFAGFCDSRNELENHVRAEDYKAQGKI